MSQVAYEKDLSLKSYTSIIRRESGAEQNPRKEVFPVVSYLSLGSTVDGGGREKCSPRATTKRVLNVRHGDPQISPFLLTPLAMDTRNCMHLCDNARID